MPPTILCYGDSITWGFDPTKGSRLPFPERWPGILQAGLPGGARVIEEALPGRTAGSDSPWLPYRNGRTTLPFLLESHAPIDLVILMLGTNDVSPTYRLGADGVAANCATLVWIVQKSLSGPGGAAPKVLLVAPPPLGNLSEFMAVFTKGGEEPSRALAKAYEVVARGCGCPFLDAGQIVSVSAADGMHLDAAAHRVLGATIRKTVEGILRLS